MKSKLPLDPDRRKHQTQRLHNKMPYEGRVAEVCDGDTIVVTAEDPPTGVRMVEYIRLAGIDAPEMRGPDARLALWSQEYLGRLVLGKTVTVYPRRIWRDPYHRIIASVTFEGLDLGTCLIEQGHAVPRKKPGQGQSGNKAVTTNC